MSVTVKRPAQAHSLLGSPQARMQGLGLPFDPEFPPLHIRVKQAVTLGAWFLGAVAFLASGLFFLVSSSFSLGVPLFAAGLALISWNMIATILTCCYPTKQTATGYTASCGCLPCISPPCHTCHGMETPPDEVDMTNLD